MLDDKLQAVDQDIGKFLEAIKTSGIDTAALINALQNGATHTNGAIEPSAKASKAPKATGSRTGLRGRPKGSAKTPSQVQQLTQLALQAPVIMGPDNETAYTQVTIDEHTELVPVKSRAFKSWLLSEYQAEYGGAAPTMTALNEACELHGLQSSTTKVDKFHTRLAVDTTEGTDTLYLNLHNAKREYVKITAEEWTVVPSIPERIIFRSVPDMAALPVPDASGTIDDLRSVLSSLPDDQSTTLVLGWLLGTFMPKGPYAHLMFYGPEGSTKSSLTCTLRNLVDPTMSDPEFAMPWREDSLMALAQQQHVLSFGNVSTIHPWLSDALCRLSTGGSTGERQLYLQGTPKILSGERPVVLNGIPLAVTRPDLVDRCIVIALERLPEHRRVTREAHEACFNALHARALGALLNAVRSALSLRGSIHVGPLPRMADFVVWCEAAGAALRWPLGTFKHAYESNKRSLHLGIFDATPLAQALRELLMSNTPHEWTGTYAQLLSALDKYWLLGTADIHASYYEWPKSARELTSDLGRLSVVLAHGGIIVVQLGHSMQGNRIALKLVE